MVGPGRNHGRNQMRYLFLSLGLLFAFAQLGLFEGVARAHPGSGIVVDAAGHVFFQDSAGRSVWRIDPDGKRSRCDSRIGGHWMTLDSQDAFARADLKLGERVTPTGGAAVLLVAY